MVLNHRFLKNLSQWHSTENFFFFFLKMYFPFHSPANFSACSYRAAALLQVETAAPQQSVWRSAKDNIAFQGCVPKDKYAFLHSLPPEQPAWALLWAQQAVLAPGPCQGELPSRTALAVTFSPCSYSGSSFPTSLYGSPAAVKADQPHCACVTISESWPGQWIKKGTKNGLLLFPLMLTRKTRGLALRAPVSRQGVKLQTFSSMSEIHLDVMDSVFGLCRSLSAGDDHQVPWLRAPHSQTPHPSGFLSLSKVTAPQQGLQQAWVQQWGELNSWAPQLLSSSLHEDKWLTSKFYPHSAFIPVYDILINSQVRQWWSCLGHAWL